MKKEGRLSIRSTYYKEGGVVGAVVSVMNKLIQSECAKASKPERNVMMPLDMEHAAAGIYKNNATQNGKRDIQKDAY